MENYELEILTKYIAVWGWHIVAMIFFVSSIIYSFFNLIIAKVFFVVFLVAFLISEIISFKRKEGIYKNEQ